MGSNTSREHNPDPQFTAINPPNYDNSDDDDTCISFYPRYRSPLHTLSPVFMPQPSSLPLWYPEFSPEKTPQQIRLPGFAFEYGPSSDLTNEIECCICAEDYYPGMILQMLPCNHAIHRPCLLAWYQKSTTCPICRLNSAITENKLNM